MGKGTATAGTPVFCATPAAIKVAVDAITLTNADFAEKSDEIAIIRSGLDGWLVFKIQYAAA